MELKWKKTRLSLEEWKNIIRNVRDFEEDYEFGNDIEILWLENETCDGGTWALCHGYELFEDGFKTETEAWRRYEEILKLLKD